MDFFKLRKFRNARKPNADDATQDMPVPEPEEAKNTSLDSLSKSVISNPCYSESEDGDEEDDDFITNEVKRRLKELQRKNFMVLIPEETLPLQEEEEEEEQGEMSSPSEWRDVEVEGRQFWRGFDALYDAYCERMLAFDRSISQQLSEIGNCCNNFEGSQTPRSAAKKLSSPFRCLSLRNVESPEGETEFLQQAISDPYSDLETAYVAQLCLTWEALHCEYTLLCRKISCQPESTRSSYDDSAQQFQQFHVLLQRFIENEPFEVGSRPETYARARKLMPKLLHVPKIQASEEHSNAQEASNQVVLGQDLVRIIEGSILCFSQFVKLDKKKSSSANSLFRHKQIETSIEKKYAKLKELWKKTKSYKKKCFWPRSSDESEIVLGLIDAKVLIRVLRMSKIREEEVSWCEEKMKKLVLISSGKLHRDPSPLLFPC